MITKQDLELVHVMADDFVKKHGLQVSQQVLVLLAKIKEVEAKQHEVAEEVKED